VQLLLPPLLSSNVSPIKTGRVWWCSITTDGTANMNFVSKTLLECCLHLLPVLCAVLYYMVHVECTVMISVVCSLLQGLVHEQLHVVNGNSLCIVCSDSIRVANHTLVQRVVNSTHIQIRLPVFVLIDFNLHINQGSMMNISCLHCFEPVLSCRSPLLTILKFTIRGTFGTTEYALRNPPTSNSEIDSVSLSAWAETVGVNSGDTMWSVI